MQERGGIRKIPITRHFWWIARILFRNVSGLVGRLCPVRRIGEEDGGLRTHGRADEVRGGIIPKNRGAIAGRLPIASAGIWKMRRPVSLQHG